MRRAGACSGGGRSDGAGDRVTVGTRLTPGAARNPGVGESWEWQRVLLACVALRAVNALALRTFFNPDEYWQSLEVAHRLVFGYGHLTWEWAAGLRGYTHPLLFAALYKALAAVGWDTQFAVSRGPLLMQAVFAAVSDLHVYLISRDIFGHLVARYALLCQLSSWFNFYCLPRTYANSLEATLTVASIYNWGLHRPITHSASRAGQRVGLSLAALSVVVRPACIPFWFLLGCSELLLANSRGLPGERAGLLADATAIAFVALAFSIGIDRIFYGRWVIVVWEFVKFNVLQGGSALYGSHPWHWNFTQGFPTIATSYLPLMLVGLWSARTGRRLGYMAAAYAALMSIPAHKEFRFLLPALQLLMPLAGWSLSRMMRCPPSKIPPTSLRQLWCRRYAIALVGVQVLMAAYFSLVHQRGTIAVMDWLATQPLHDSTGTDSIPPPLLFLMPCHSTPFYSHLHRPTPMQFLDCSPPGWAHTVAQLNSHPVITPSAIISDDDRILRVDDFRKAPAEFLESLLSSSSSVGGASLPTHIIMFDAVTTQPGVVEALGEAGYQLYVQFFHSHFAVDQNGPQGRVVVFTPSVTPADEPSWRDNKELS